MRLESCWQLATGPDRMAAWAIATGCAFIRMLGSSGQTDQRCASGGVGVRVCNIPLFQQVSFVGAMVASYIGK